MQIYAQKIRWYSKLNCNDFNLNRQRLEIKICWILSMLSTNTDVIQWSISEHSCQINILAAFYSIPPLFRNATLSDREMIRGGLYSNPLSLGTKMAIYAATGSPVIYDVSLDLESKQFLWLCPMRRSSVDILSGSSNYMCTFRLM